MDILNDEEKKIALENGFDDQGFTPIHKNSNPNDLLTMRVQQMALFVDGTIFVKVKQEDTDFLHAQYISTVQWKNQLKTKPTPDKIKDITSSQIGNIAYLSLHDPTEERRQKWKDILEDVISLFSQNIQKNITAEDSVEFCCIM